MVARFAFERTLVLTALLASIAAGGGCGGESSRSVGTASGTGGTGGVAGNAGRAGAGRAGLGAAAGAVSGEIELDGPPCETRRAADCTGIADLYSSSGVAFDSAPELVACSAYVSFDGCGKLIYSFDTNGCVVSVGPGPGGWKDSEHLAPLRDCLSKVFGDARFSCLGSGTLAFYESCYVPR